MRVSADGHHDAVAAAAHRRRLAEVFGDAVPVVLDGGLCTGGPSTVVDCTGAEPKLLREGRIPWADVQAAMLR